MGLSPPQQQALSRLTTAWQTARKLGAHTNTMKYLCAYGYAERFVLQGFNIASHVKYRLSTAPRWSEAGITDTLAGKWPQYRWEVTQGSLVFALKAAKGVVSFGHNLAVEDLHEDDDVIQAGRIAVEGLRAALWRWEWGK